MAVAQRRLTAEDLVHAAVHRLGERQAEHAERERRLERNAALDVVSERRARDVQQARVRPVVEQWRRCAQVLRREQEQPYAERAALNATPAAQWTERDSPVEPVERRRQRRHALHRAIAAQRERYPGRVVSVAVLEREQIVVDVHRPFESTCR